ncbi:phosphoribosylamine--glycine ligase [soil metagenome]
MKILLVGNGGREHALAEKIIKSPTFTTSDLTSDKRSILYSTTGNPGIDNISTALDINSNDVNSLLEFALKEKIDLTIVGPEIPLSLGIADEFQKKGLLIFGPTYRAAEIETSKIFSKDLMKRSNIPTAEFMSFTSVDTNEIAKFLEVIGYPAVIKADGPAAGKGVIIAQNAEEAQEAIYELSESKIFGESGAEFVIEKFLKGNEVSLFIITDGDDYILFPTAQDHKRIYDNDEGKNTGGMGAFSPASKFFTNEVKKKTEDKIIRPILQALKKENRKFKGCLYAGLIVDESGEPYVIEFNCRFGDPETQCVLELVEGDLPGLFKACAEGKLKEHQGIEFKKGFSACVVLSSGGYPDKYEIDKVISGLDRIDKDIKIFYSGVRNDNGVLKTNGGRVLSLVSYSEKSLRDAIEKVYENVSKVNFDGMHYRKDIGNKGIS